MKNEREDRLRDCVIKTARTVPITKGLKCEVTSYGPISLIPVFSKVFESVMSLQLYEYLELHELLVPV